MLSSRGKPLTTRTHPLRKLQNLNWGTRQCSNVGMLQRGLVINLTGGAATGMTDLLAGAAYSFLAQDEPDYQFISRAGSISFDLACVGMGIHYIYLAKKYVNS